MTVDETGHHVWSIKLAAVLTISAFPALASAQPVVAVFSIQDAKKKVDPETLHQLTEYLSAQIGEGGLYRVVPSDTLKKELLGQKVESYQSCYDEGCQIEIGKALAAEKSLSTQLLRFGSKRCILKSTLYDLEQEVSDRVATVKGGCTADDLLSHVETVAAKLKEGLLPSHAKVDKADLPAAPTDLVSPGGIRCKPAERCYELGIDHRDGTGGKAKDSQRALLFLLEGCRQSYGPACTDAGYIIEQGGTDDERAAQLYTRGCELKSAMGCTNTGYMYEKGKGLNLDYRLAVRFYEKGCRSGNARGCTNLGYMYRNGKGVPQSDKMAKQLYQKACRSQGGGGCTNLGFLFETGRGVGRSLPKAAELYERGCSTGSAVGCTNLGYLYERGRGVGQDQKLALHFYRLGCQQGNDRGCRIARKLQSE